MGQVTLLQRGYSRGIKRDVPRDQMEQGSLWNCVDFIPNSLDAPLRKRGGWSHGSDALGAGSYAAAAAFADFTTGSKLVVINDSGALYSVNPSTLAVTSEGAAQVPVAPMPLHRNVLVIPSPDGSTSVKKYTSGAPAALAASAPAGIHAAVYKDRTVLANVAAEPQRVYFGPGGVPTGTWDTTSSYIDASFPITALAAMRNVVVVFGRGRCERIRGSTPPPNTDMVREPLFDTGCIDARTVVPYGDNIIFANQEGIWLTDGSVLENLAESAGLLTYWLDLMDDYASTWTLAAGLHRGHYVVSVMDGSTFVDGIALEVNSRLWFRLSNVKARMFARAVGASEELYFARRDSPRVGALSSMFFPTDSVRNDADGTAVTPLLETSFFKDKATTKRWHRAYLGYELTAPSTTATLALSYITAPEATSYTALASFSEQSSYDRVRKPMQFRARGVAFKIAQSAASADTRIHEIEAEVHSLEGSR